MQPDRRMSEEDAWAAVELAQDIFSDQAAKELAYQLGLVQHLPDIDEPVPSRPARAYH